MDTKVRIKNDISK